MPSNFDSNATDLEDIFAPRSWFKLGPVLFSWGSNDGGPLGQNDSINRSSPVQVGVLANWSQVSAGSYFSGAVKTDKTLWTFGRNGSGQLGLNNTINRSSPVQVGLTSDWYNIEAGYSTTFAIKNNGTIWSWGSGASGVLGLNSTINRSSPTQIGLLDNWNNAAAGSYGSISAVKTDGTLWSWGVNTGGVLGLNDLIDRSSPTQVGTLTNWKQTAQNYFTLAVKTDGTLWGWGNSGLFGSLGLNSALVSFSSPVQIGALTNWSKVAAENLGAGAIKLDGTLWGWGYNTRGTIGLNNSLHRSSPTQVGTLTNWTQISRGAAATAALKSDGTLWTWGSNSYGALGLSDSVRRSSPTQVGSLLKWKDISMSPFEGPILGIVNQEI